MKTGEWEKAEKAYLTALNLSQDIPDSKGYHDLALLYLSQNCLMAKEYDKSKNYTDKLFLTNSFLIDRAYTVLAEIELKTNHIENSIQFCLKSLEINPLQPHQYINLASLTKDSKLKKDYMKSAIILNSNLLNPQIYKRGEVPNIFTHQSAFLSSVDSVKQLVKTIDLDTTL